MKHFQTSVEIYSASVDSKYVFISAGGLRAGPGEERADEDVQQRGGDAVVPAAGRAAGLHRVLHPH